MSYTLSVDVVGEVIPQSRVGEAMTVITFANSISASVGPAAFGIVVTAFANTSYPGGAFLAIAGVMLCGILCSSFLPTNQALTEMRTLNSSSDMAMSLRSIS